MALSEKSRAILQAIPKGRTYEQIFVQDLTWTYHDVFQAAVEALETPHVTNASKSRKFTMTILAPTRSGVPRRTNNFLNFAETGNASEKSQRLCTDGKRLFATGCKLNLVASP